MNIYDIAKATGFSTATVSRVLNNTANVSKKTRDKIINYCNENNYKPSYVAQTLSKRESKNIALIIPDIKNEFFTGIHRGLSTYLKEYGFNVSLFDTNDDISNENDFLIELVNQFYAGVVIVPVQEDNENTYNKLKELEDRNIPVVLIDRDLREPEFDGVFVENEKGAYEAVQYLIDKGSNKIAIITGPLNSKPAIERFSGYKKALSDNNIQINDDFIVEGDFKIDKAKKGFEYLFSQKIKPDAIFASNNLTTLGILSAAKSMGYKVGKDFMLAGFDEVDVVDLLDINCKMVSRPVDEMGTEAAKILVKRLAGNKSKRKRRIFLEAYLRL